jgi:hypothetical protein
MENLYALQYTGAQVNEAVRRVLENDIEASVTEKDKEEIVNEVLSNFINAAEVAL